MNILEAMKSVRNGESVFLEKTDGNVIWLTDNHVLAHDEYGSDNWKVAYTTQKVVEMFEKVDNTFVFSRKDLGSYYQSCVFVQGRFNDSISVETYQNGAYIGQTKFSVEEFIITFNTSKWVKVW